LRRLRVCAVVVRMFSRKRSGSGKGQALAVTVASLQPCEKSGWLLKQGKRFHHWEQQFFVLKAKKLYCFSSDTAGNASSMIHMDETCSTRREKESGKQTSVFSVEGLCLYKGKIGNKKLILAAGSAEELQDWLTAIDGACNSMKDSVPDAATEGSALGHGAARTDAVGTRATTTAGVDGAALTTGDHVRQESDGMLPEISDCAAKMTKARNAVGFLTHGTQMEQFWDAWMTSMPKFSELDPTKSMVFSVATSADMENATWRISGPQSLFAPKIVSFFYNMGSPMTEVDRMNDVGALINPRNVGSWIQTSLNGGMDGGWTFPAEIPMKLAVEAADSTEAEDDAVRALSQWADANDVLVCISVSRDMGKSPPQQTEFRMILPGADFNIQLAIAKEAASTFHFPPFPDDTLAAFQSTPPTEPMQLSVVTCARGFVRIGLLVPGVPMTVVTSLLQSNGGQLDEINDFMTAAGCTSPAYVELQCLNKGYGYGVYKEGFSVVLHWDLGTETRN